MSQAGFLRTVWHEEKLIFVNKIAQGAGKVLLVRRNASIHQYMLGDAQLEGGSAEKGLGVLAKANSILGCIGQSIVRD